jgi:hypothetical protein
MTTHYLGITDIAKDLGVYESTIRAWSNTHATPEPDITCGPGKMRGWLPERIEEWRHWYKVHLMTRDERYVRTVWKRKK